MSRHCASAGKSSSSFLVRAHCLTLPTLASPVLSDCVMCHREVPNHSCRHPLSHTMLAVPATKVSSHYPYGLSTIPARPCTPSGNLFAKIHLLQVSAVTPGSISHLDRQSSRMTGCVQECYLWLRRICEHADYRSTASSPESEAPSCTEMGSRSCQVLQLLNSAEHA